jgi:hypothetical protein
MLSRAVRGRSQVTRRASVTSMPAHQRTVTNTREAGRVAAPIAVRRPLHACSEISKVEAPPRPGAQRLIRPAQRTVAGPPADGVGRAVGWGDLVDQFGHPWAPAFAEQDDPAGDDTGRPVLRVECVLSPAAPFERWSSRRSCSGTSSSRVTRSAGSSCATAAEGRRSAAPDERGRRRTSRPFR